MVLVLSGRVGKGGRTMVATRDDVGVGELAVGLIEDGAVVNLFERASSRCPSVGRSRETGVVCAGSSADDSMADDSMAGVELDGVPELGRELHGVDGEDERSRLLGEIVGLNPTATSVFLSLFSRAQLAEYRDHLVATREPRGRRACWERRASTPAIVWRDSDSSSRRVRGEVSMAS